jgi:hypothetical protein
LSDVVTELPVEKSEDFLIVRKQNVGAAKIEGVPVLDEALAVTAGLPFEFENFALMCRAAAADYQADQSSPKYPDPHDSHFPERSSANAPTRSPEKTRNGRVAERETRIISNSLI